MMRGENILLSEKEARRVYVMEKVLEGQLTVKEGARLLNLSERQVKRLKIIKPFQKEAGSKWYV
jgi:transcriptional regulator GlxA family with amidase domain